MFFFLISNTFHTEFQVFWAAPVCLFVGCFGVRSHVFIVIIRCEIYWIVFGFIDYYEFTPFVKHNLLRPHTTPYTWWFDLIWSDRVQNTRLMMWRLMWCKIKLRTRKNRNHININMMRWHFQRFSIIIIDGRMSMVYIYLLQANFFFSIGKG